MRKPEPCSLADPQRRNYFLRSSLPLVPIVQTRVELIPADVRLDGSTVNVVKSKRFCRPHSRTGRTTAIDPFLCLLFRHRCARVVQKTHTLRPRAVNERCKKFGLVNSLDINHRTVSFTSESSYSASHRGLRLSFPVQ